jgi:hypothetical protein
VAGTFGTTKGEDAIRAADVPLTRPTLDRRRERLVTAALANPDKAPKRLLLPLPIEDDLSWYRKFKWFIEVIDEGRLIWEG